MINIKSIIIGTANFFQDYGINNSLINNKEKKRIYNYLKKKQIFDFDISDSYGKYYEDRNFLEIKKKKINYKFKLKNFDNNLSDILIKLRVKKLECLMIHDENELTSKKNIIKFNKIKKLNKKKKFFRTIGVSVYTVGCLINIINNNIKVDVVQLPLNIFNQAFDHNHILKKLKKKKIKIHVRSLFLQGLLLKNSNNIFNKLLKKKMINFEDLVKKNKSKKIDLCIDYIKTVKYVDKVILGFDSLQQLQTIIKVLDKKKKNIDYNQFCNIKTKFVDPRKWKKILVSS